MQNDITNNLGLGYNIGYEWDGFSTIPVFIYSVSVGLAITDKLEAFVEGFGSTQKHEPGQIYVDGGVGFYLSPNLKLDTYFGVGISDASINNFFGAGVSFRLNTKKTKSRQSFNRSSSAFSNSLPSKSIAISLPCLSMR
jgi:hypothetical protein